MSSIEYSHAPTDKLLLEKIRSSIGNYISGKRLEHTFSVENESVSIAGFIFPYLGIDDKYISDIRAAALLHDITKQYSAEMHRAVCSDYSLPYVGNDAVIHSRTGAYIAKRDFGINDIVFGAIFNHTTGKSNMNIFEKIIFTADFIEKTRSHASCIAARNYFYENIQLKNKLYVLNKTILISIDATLHFLLEKESVIDLETVSARNSIISELASMSEEF